MLAKQAVGLMNKPAAGRCYVTFWLANVAASLSDAQTPQRSNASSSDTAFIAPRDVYITGISARVTSATGSAGTITITPFAGGSDPGTAYDITITNNAATISGSATFATPLLLSANTALTVALTTSGDWSATAGDVHIDVELRA